LFFLALFYIFSDLKFFKRHASIDEEDVTHVEALIIGPPDTPYDGDFFHFGTDYSNMNVIFEFFVDFGFL
jgi:hypothetical protein